MEFGGEIQDITRHGEFDIVAEVFVGEEAAGVLGVGHGGEEVAAGGEVEVAGDGGGVGDLRSAKLGPERVAQGAGDNGVFVGGFFVGAGADDDDIRAAVEADPAADGAEVEGGGDQDGAGAGAGLEGAGAVGGGHDDFHVGDALDGEFARGIAEIEIDAAGLPGFDEDAVALAGEEGLGMGAFPFEGVGDFLDRENARGAVGERREHGGGGAQGINDHADGLGQIAALEGGEFRRGKQHFQIRCHGKQFADWTAQGTGWGGAAASAFCGGADSDGHGGAAIVSLVCRMKIISDPRCLEFAAAGHPERPQRIEGALRALRAQDQLALTWAEPGTVDDAALLRAHTPEHLRRLEEVFEFDADTPTYPKIAEHARRAAAGALRAMEAGRAGETAFSLLRPPGHHATPNRAMGFCYLNSIAIAAQAAQAAGSRRVAVFDFDVHHGNGTEDILLDRPGCAFYSIHQFPAYPGTGQTNRGGNCFNYPLAPGTLRGEYRAVLASALEQMKKFKPDLVAVSAGFDAYRGDPLAQETLEAEDFHWLGETIRGLGIPAFSVLEGGYSDDLPELILAYLRGLEGK